MDKTVRRDYLHALIELLEHQMQELEYFETYLNEQNLYDLFDDYNDLQVDIESTTMLIERTRKALGMRKYQIRQLQSN